MALTPRQKELLDFISGFQDEHGYCPSYDEIARGLELASLATVHKHIAALSAKGYLNRTENHSRSLEIGDRYFDETKGSRATRMPRFEIPIEGQIAAGVPVEAYADRQVVDFGDFAGSDSTYALQVRGESMIEDHICDGDFVLIERTDSVRNGDVVVALVRGSESTLKRYYRESDGSVRLQPANHTMEPIRVGASDIQVQGRLLAVLRKYR
jgi:repressor LexA